MTAKGSGSGKNPSFYQNVEKFLLQRLKETPASPELRVQLIEVYFETAQEEAFLREARQLRASIADIKRSPAWATVQSMGRMLVPGDALFRDDPGGALEFVSPNKLIETQQKRHVRIGEDEKLRPHFHALAGAYDTLRADPKFMAEFDMELVRFAGRPSSLFHAARLSKHFGGAQIYFKREDLAPPHPHLIMNVVGQAFVAKKLGRKTLVTSSKHGYNGVIVASVAAHFGLGSVVFMTGEDMQQQNTNIFRMWMLGADTIEPPVSRGQAAMDVRQAALEHWAKNAKDCFPVPGLDAIPHPFPTMAQDFCSVIGRECRRQVYALTKRAPDLLVARAGNHSDVIGYFPPFLAETQTRLVCVEGRADLGDANAVPRAPGVNVFDPATHRITGPEIQKAGAVIEGLDYPSVTREHAWFRASGRVEYVRASVAVAKQAIKAFSHQEGIIPAIETAHAIGWACQEAAKMSPEQAVVVMLADSSDKDIWSIAGAMGMSR